MGKARARSDADTKAERKFQKKLDFYSKVRESVATLSAQKTIAKKKKLSQRQKKLKAYDLSSLSDYLPELEAEKEPKPTSFKLNSKTRQNLVLKEGNQLKAVINHPAFQSDPLAAIYQHLQSTQPVVEEKPKRKDKKGGKKKEKRKNSKALSRPQSMDI